MNIRTEILKEHSRKQTIKIATYIGHDKKLFSEAMKLFFANEYRVTQRMAAVINACFEKNPDLLKPYFKAMINNLENKNIHDAVKRNTVRILQFVDIPIELQGVTFENCMNLLLEPKEPIAVKAFSMTVLANLCRIEPDLKNEVKIAIESQLPFGSAGFKNRGVKTLKFLEKLN